MQARTIDFDINFLNYEDPEVFERLTGPDFEKHMKATYGMDYVAKLATVQQMGNESKLAVDETLVYKYCAESENR
jgi:hypothetical protein